MSGWIKLHREINSHWVWSNSEYLKWWIDILIEANHAPAKVLIKGKLYECNRGEKLYSLDTWAKRWGTNKSKVKRFFDLLQNDKMITYKSETQTTRITICKYVNYQGKENESETQTKHKRNASETQVKPIKEEQEEENNKALPFSFYNSLIQIGAEKNLVSDWLKVRKNKKATNTETALKKFLTEVEKSEYNINDVLEKCIEKSWSGFQFEWLEKEKPLETDPEKTIDFDAFLNYYKSVYKKCQLVNIPEATKKRFLELLQCGYTKNQLMFAIKNSYKDEYNRDKINIETFSFSSSLEKYLKFKEDKL